MKKIKSILTSYYPIILIFLLSLLYTLPQIINHSLIFGSDVSFHFNRLYDNYMQIKTHNFSIFQSNFGFFQSGRIVNALYGPGFAWILSIILYILHSWVKFQIITSFIIYLISGLLMYQLTQKIKISKPYSTLASLLYMSTYWITSWQITESYMAWGAMLMPIVLMAGIDIVEFDKCNFSTVKLALVVSIMTQVHLLSALFSIAVLVPFFIIGMIANKNKILLLKKVVLAAILTLVLTFNVWGAMIDVFKSNTLISVFPVKYLATQTTHFSLGQSSIYELGFFMSLFVVFQLLYCMYHYKTLSNTDKLFSFLGTIFVILSSNLTPWNFIGKKIVILQSYLQFPYRFLTLACVFLIPIGFKFLSNIHFNYINRKKFLLTILSIISIVVFIQNISFINSKAKIWNTKRIFATQTPIVKIKHFNKNRYRKAMMSKNLGKGLKMATKTEPDYLPTTVRNIYKHQKPYDIYRNEIVKNQKGFKKYVRGSSLIIEWDGYQKKRVPIVIYKNSKVILNGHSINHSKLCLSKIGVPTINGKQQVNRLQLSYHSNVVNEQSILFVIIFWIFILIKICLGYIKKVKVK